MKKKAKKIALAKETLKDLTMPEAQNAAGGATVTGHDCIFCQWTGEPC